MKRLKEATVRFARMVGMDDLFFWGGLVLLWFGLWAVYPPAAPIATGVTFLAIALYGATRRPRE